METREKTDHQTPAQKLLQEALLRNEGVLASNGAFSVNTGSRTGRSPKDRFIVDDDITHLTVDWGTVNQAINYAVFDALMKRIEQTNCSIFLVNTGWTGGTRDQGGKRFPIPVTRAIVSAILNGQLDRADYETIPYFKLHIPKCINGIDAAFLNPRTAWSSTSAYDQTASILARAFADNIALMNVSADIASAGPTDIHEK